MDINRKLAMLSVLWIIIYWSLVLFFVFIAKNYIAGIINFITSLIWIIFGFINFVRYKNFKKNNKFGVSNNEY